MEKPLPTLLAKKLGIILLVLWAALYLPHLRTSPNWYGDEGEWMEKCWQLAHGHARIGPVVNDFIYPYPYPPLYMAITGTLLRIFGDDVVVGRAFGVVVALAAAGLLFWIGTRLKDSWLGFLSAAAFLVYENADVNFRWVRSHPFAGTLALAAIGFLIRYLQERRLRDLVLGGLFTALATASNYYTVGMIPAVIAAAAWVNWRSWRKWTAWREVVIGAAAAGSYGVLFLIWYLLTKGGLSHLREQVHLMGGMADATPISEIVQRIGKFFFETPTGIGPNGPTGKDLWLCLAAIGLVAFPIARLRGWLVFWALLLMWPIFKKQDNVSWFFYPATIFLPLLALGVGGALDQAGKLAGLALKKQTAVVRLAPGIVALLFWFSTTARDAWGHFDTMIDGFTQQSIPEAEAAMAYVNAHTTADDFVLVPKQIYWLVKDARRSMLSHCGPYVGQPNSAWPAPIARDLYWFDCQWQNAKYAVIASGVLTAGPDQPGHPIGIDLLYTRGAAGGQEPVAGMVASNWPVVFPAGARVIYPPQLGGRWPVLVGGEYLVLANPKFVRDTP